MTLSYSIDHLSTTVEDVSVEVAAKSEMTLQSTSVKDGKTTTIYRLASGSDVFPAYVTYSSEIQTRKGMGSVRNVVIEFSTWATMADSVSGIDTKRPLSAVFVLNLPADMTIEVADLDDLIGNCFSFLYPSVTTKVRSTTWLQNFIYGIPKAA
jgi:hypothetical protein